VGLEGLDEQNSRYSLANGTKNPGIHQTASLTYWVGGARRERAFHFGIVLVSGATPIWRTSLYWTPL
jgi:hypothetical protein